MKLTGPQFSDATTQAFFDENGYVKVRLLTSEQAEQLRHAYDSVKSAHEKIAIPFITTSHSNDADLIGKVNEMILNVVKEPIYKIILNSNIIFSNFLVKRNGEDSESNPHQDLTIVDENKYLSYSVWVALEDVDVSNGAMRVLPRSHLFDFSLRPNPNYYWKYNAVMDEIKKDMADCPAKKGEALIFAHSLIHGSHKNLSGRHRLACVVSLHPREAELYNFFLDAPESKYVKKYKMSVDAFIKYIKGKPPHFGELLEELPFSNRQISKEEYRAQYALVN